MASTGREYPDPVRASVALILKQHCVLNLDMWVGAGGCSQVSARDCRLLGDSGEPPAEAPKPLTNPRALARGPAPPPDAAVQRRHCPRVTSRTGVFMYRRIVEPAPATAGCTEMVSSVAACSSSEEPSRPLPPTPGQWAAGSQGLTLSPRALQCSKMS